MVRSTGWTMYAYTTGASRGAPAGLTVLELEVLDGEGDDGGVLLDEVVVLGEARQRQDEVAGQASDPVLLPLVHARLDHVLFIMRRQLWKAFRKKKDNTRMYAWRYQRVAKIN